MMTIGHWRVYARRVATAAGFFAALSLVITACGSRDGAAERVGTVAEALSFALPLFDTGVNAAGNAARANGAIDLHYSITASTDVARPAPRTAIVTAPNPAWAAPTAPAKWISLDAGACAGCVVGTYTYSTTFVMPADVNVATATIALTMAADDSATISLNGAAVFTGGAFGATTNVTIGPNQAAFAQGTNTLTFAVNNSGGTFTGLLVEAIVGSVSNTCAVDSDCAFTDFCNTATTSCTPKLANGVAIPIVAGHTPPLAGACTMAVGAAVCASAVCDAKDQACGFANGDGPCTLANAMTVCQSGACGPSSLVCIPASGCAADADCTAAQFCNTATFTCAPKLGNGVAVPTIANHLPALTGVCTLAVGLAVCTAAVCDVNGEACGYANGDGPCTTGTGGTVCRSGVCSAHVSSCVPPGGCAVDADCTPTQFCNTATFACAPKLANGITVPTIANHAPALTGTCTLAVGTAVCSAAVCDVADSECGYANGDGTCTIGNAATVCRSGACDPGDSKCGLASGDGICSLANAATICRSGACSAAQFVCIPPGGCAVDADCTSAQYCNTPTLQCVAKLADGASIPTVAGHAPAVIGTCTVATGAVVCVAGVCDTKDNACGYANGDGTCTIGTAASVCRSAACDPGDSKCGLADGDGPCAVDNASTVCRSHGCSATAMVCTAPGTCVVDADCASSQFCNTATSACTAKLTNGTPIPTIAAHTPALAGSCTMAVGVAVCVAAVCEPADNKCGFVNGGSCLSGAVCRSQSCVGGTCAAAGVGDAGAEAGAAADASAAALDAAVAAADSGPKAAVDAGDASALAPVDGGAQDDGSAQDAGGEDVAEAALAPPLDATTSPPGSDSGESATPDAGQIANTPSDGAFIEGGGIRCSTSPGGGGSSAPLVGVAFGLVVAGLRGRRRRARAASSF